MPETIFISYRSKDSDKVDTIVANLRSLKDENGNPQYFIWQDKVDIPPGRDWWSSIVDAIIKCKIFVFMVSQESIQSVNCLAELSYAHKINRHILPIVLQGEYQYNLETGKNDTHWDKMPSELKDERQRRQLLFDNGTKSLQVLVQALDNLLLTPKKDLYRTVSRPPDPRHIDDPTNNTTAIYNEACDSAWRGDFANAESKFLQLLNLQDSDFSDEAGDWIGVVRDYQKIIEFDMSENTRHKAREKWKEYESNFPKTLRSILDNIFDPRGLRERYDIFVSNTVTYFEIIDLDKPVSVTNDKTDDELYEEAVEMVRRLNKASVGLLQRRLRLSYTRALSIVKLMELQGVVGPEKDGSKPREVIPHNSFHLRPATSELLPQPFKWCYIPSGLATIVIGQLENNYYVIYEKQQFDVNEFFISKYPITNAQYQVFIDSYDGYINPIWWDYSVDAKLWRKNNSISSNTGFLGHNHPITNITWYEGVAFTRWLTMKLGLEISLPTEQQWQRAAIGDNDWNYPYGDELDKNKCNFKTYITTDVTQYPSGASPYGVMDMSGNTLDWCLTEYDLGNIPLQDSNNNRSYVLRGGSMSADSYALSSKFRFGNQPFIMNGSRGIRIISHLLTGK